MKEDVLEQVVDDYLRSLGFLTHSNVRFRPSQQHPDWAAQQDSGWSDIDVIGYCPTRYGADRVWVVSCKSWQTGLDPGKRLDQLRAGKEWQVHREVWVPKWGRALCDAVERLTGQRAFRFFTAVTLLKGQVERWAEWGEDPQVKECLEGNWVGFLRLEDMWRRTLEATTTTLASSVMGRLAQMLLAAGQAPVQSTDMTLDGELVAPYDLDAEWCWPSEAAMWMPPPLVADCEGINYYGNTLNGYFYASRHYGAEPSSEGLRRLLDTAPRWPRRSYELLRLEQFYEVRGWHFDAIPESDEGIDAAMCLHQQLQAAWAAHRFDRQDVPPHTGHHR